MKTFYAIAIAVMLPFAAFAQCSVVVTQSTNVTCFGMCDGSASLATVGLFPYTYSWAPGGQTVQNPTDLCPGTHTVTMTDANSCQSTATVTITEPQDISVNSSVSNVTCNGTCNGHAQVTVTGGTAPYGYSWNDPQNSATDTANSLCPASYTCTITDFNGCSKFTVVTITEPSALADVITTAPANCHGSCDGVASTQVAGGTAPYTYSWSSGCTTSTCTQLCAGGYAITVTDANNCVLNDSAFISEPSQIVPNASGTDATCLQCNDGMATCAPSGGTGNYVYAWSPGGQTTQTITGLSPGNYVVCVTDMNGCTVCDTVTVAASSGIVENDLGQYFSLYPNPAGSVLFIHSTLNGKVSYRIYDVTGNIVSNGEYENAAGSTKEIGVNGLSRGLYFLEIRMDEGTLVQRISKN